MRLTGRRDTVILMPNGCAMMVVPWIRFLDWAIPQITRLAELQPGLRTSQGHISLSSHGPNVFFSFLPDQFVPRVISGGDDFACCATIHCALERSCVGAKQGEEILRRLQALDASSRVECIGSSHDLAPPFPTWGVLNILPKSGITPEAQKSARTHFSQKFVIVFSKKNVAAIYPWITCVSARITRNFARTNFAKKCNIFMFLVVETEFRPQSDFLCDTPFRQIILTRQRFLPFLKA